MNKGSTYTNATFNEITSRIFNRLVKSLQGRKAAQIKIDERYPGHTNYLTKSGLAPKLFPSFKTFISKNKLQN